jgi:hypothetical protein
MIIAAAAVASLLLLQTHLLLLQNLHRGCWLWINAKTLEGALDPLFVALSMAVSLAALGAGIYTIIRSKSFDFSVSSWNDFTQVIKKYNQ